MRSPTIVLAAVVCTVLGTACGDSIWGSPTQSTCPPESTLTYDDFVKPFMTKYCTKCHDSAKVGRDRHGAPSFHDFDTYFGVVAVDDHIDETTAAGPASVNTGMPQDSPFPTLAERRMLGEWLACDKIRRAAEATAR